MFQTISLKLPYSYQLRQVYSGVFVGVIVLSILGGLISRKVEIRKFGFAWVVGMVLSAGYLFAGPEKYFANVPPSEFPKTFALWKEGSIATAKVATVYDDLENAFGQDMYYFNDRRTLGAEQKTAVLQVISNKIPELLKIQPSYIELKGKLTSGYLAPASRNTADSYYARLYFGDLEGSFRPPTGNIFPWTMFALKYVQTPQEAVQAWQDSLRSYSGLREFGSMVERQKEFLINGEMITRKTKTEMAWATLLPISSSSLVYVLILIIGNWLLSKVPNLTLHTSFQRRLA